MKHTRSLSEFSCLSEYTRLYPYLYVSFLFEHLYRVKSGNFGHQLNSDRDLVCFVSLIIGIKNKLT